jgi:hypothetical protein
MKQNYLTNNRFLKVLLLATGLAFANSCVNPDDLNFDRVAETKWNPDMALPLVNSSLTASDIITKGDKAGKIEVASDKFCTLVYKNELDIKTGEELLFLPDQTMAQQNGNITPLAVAAFGVAPIGATASYSTNSVVNFSSGSMVMDSVLFDSGSLSFTAVSTMLHDASVTFTLTSATKNGFPLVVNTVLNAANSYQSTVTIPVNGYSFDLTNGGSQTNKIPVKMDVTLTKTSAGNLPTTSDKISFTPSMNNLDWKRVHGDMGTFTMSAGIPDTIIFAAFRNSFFTGHIVHADPKVIFEIRNSFGIPMQVDFISVKGNIPAPNPGAGDFVVTGSGVTTPLSVTAPTLAQIGQQVISSRTLDKNNSNVRDVINNNPYYFITKINFVANPTGTPSSHNFITDTSTVRANVRCELPLYGKASNFEIVKEFDFEFKDTDAVESATIRSIMSNGFPLDLEMQIYFVDAFGNPVDSLVKSAANRFPVKAGVIDGTGKVVTPTVVTTDNTIEELRWKVISSLSKKIRIKANISSQPSADDIKIFSDYVLGVQLSARVKIKVELKNK